MNCERCGRDVQVGRVFNIRAREILLGADRLHDQIVRTTHLNLCGSCADRGFYRTECSTEKSSGTTSYSLQLTEAQAEAIRDATELMARIGIGQLDCVADFTPMKAMDSTLRLRDGLRELEPLATGLVKNSCWGIESRQTPEAARTAWDIYQVLRHRLSWDRHPEGGWTDNFDEPYKVGKEPLATMERLP